MVELALIEKKQPVPLPMLRNIQDLLEMVASKDVTGLAVIYIDRETGTSNSFAFNHSHEAAMGLVREMKGLDV
jgi:hypothetical protein